MQIFEITIEFEYNKLKKDCKKQYFLNGITKKSFSGD